MTRRSALRWARRPGPCRSRRRWRRRPSGEADFKKCKACHSIIAPDGTAIQKGGKTGPNLYGVIGRPVASYPDFKYGEGILAAGATGAVWDEALIAAYVVDPAAWLKEQSGDPTAQNRRCRSSCRRAARTWRPIWPRSRSNPATATTATPVRTRRRRRPFLRSAAASIRWQSQRLPIPVAAQLRSRGRRNTAEPAWEPPARTQSNATGDANGRRSHPRPRRTTSAGSSPAGSCRRTTRTSGSSICSPAASSA